MLAKMSNCVAFYHPDARDAARFYRENLGMKLVSEEGRFTELRAGPLRLFLENGGAMGPVLEFIVPDVEQAREQLVAKGCTVVRWEGAGKDCYIRDPFGLTFNLWEDAAQFERGEYDSDETHLVEDDGLSDEPERGEYVP